MFKSNKFKTKQHLLNFEISLFNIQRSFVWGNTNFAAQQQEAVVAHVQQPHKLFETYRRVNRTFCRVTVICKPNVAATPTGCIHVCRAAAGDRNALLYDKGHRDRFIAQISVEYGFYPCPPLPPFFPLQSLIYSIRINGAYFTSTVLSIYIHFYFV